MIYPENKISLDQVILRYNGDPSKYGVTQKLFGNVGLLLFCLESVNKEKWKDIEGFPRDYDMMDINSVMEECQRISGFWRKNEGRKTPDPARCLRDGVAHRNIYFIGDGEIRRIIFWNSYDGNPRKLKSVLSIAEEDLSHIFDAVTKFCEKNSSKYRNLLEVD